MSKFLFLIYSVLIKNLKCYSPFTLSFSLP